MKHRGPLAALRWFVALVVAFGLGAWATAVVVEDPTDPPDAPEQLWYTVAEDTVSRQVSIGVRSEWAVAQAITSPAFGVLTEQLVPDGASADDGTVVGTVDLQPVVVAVGTIPSFRSLGLDTTGRDVGQLQDLLRRAGYLRGDASGTFDAATEAAVRRWERELDVPETGAVPLGRIVYVPTLPAPVRWVATPGDALSPGQPMVEVLRPEPVFTALLSPDQADELAAGTAVAITSPTGASWQGTLGRGVSQADAIEVDLQASCVPGCAELPVTSQTRLRGDVTLVPATTGPVVPISAIRVDEDRQEYVVVRARGRTPVTIRATAAGMSVVEGVDAGDEVAIPVDPG